MMGSIVSELGLEVKELDGITVISPLGRIDVSQMLKLKKVFEDLEKETVLKIAIDMTDVAFIDSSGVGLIVNFLNRQKNRQGHLVFYGCNEDILDLLDITGLSQIVPIYDSFEAVKERFS